MGHLTIFILVHLRDNNDGRDYRASSRKAIASIPCTSQEAEKVASQFRRRNPHLEEAVVYAEFTERHEVRYK